MKLFFAAILSIFIYNLNLISDDNVTPSDSVKTQRIPDSLLSLPLYNHGKFLSGKYNKFRNINKRDIQLINYTGLNDIISHFTPFYSQDMGSYSTYNSFFALGAPSRSISWGFNGRNINDIEIGSLNPEQFPTEFFENIEIFTGADAVVFGDNAASVFVNIQEIRYNSALPFTRIWFGNSGFGYLGADGIFSQNVMPNVNFTFGFRSYNSNGAFTNTWGDNWNARVILRWNPDNLTSISFTENFSNLGSGTSGGNNPEISNSVFDEIGAIPVFSGLNERLFRHDLSITATRNFDTNTTNTAVLNFYISSIRRDRSSGSDLNFGLSDTTSQVYKTTSNFFGTEGRYEIAPVDAISLRFGGSAEVDLIERTYYHDEFNGVSTAGFAHSTIIFSDDFDINGGVRFFSKFGNVGLAYGVKQNLNIAKNLKLTADLSYSDRLPYPVEGLSLKSEQHLALAGEMIYRLNEHAQLITGAYLRSIFSPIMAEFNPLTDDFNYINHFNGSSITRTGLYLDFSGDILKNLSMRLHGLLQYSIDDAGNQIYDLPIITTSGRLFYTYKPGKSMLRVGVETGLLTDFRGDYFYPVTRSFYPGNHDSGIMLTGITAFLEVKLGDAFVKVQYENILSQNYYYVAVNPMFTGNLRLTANWTFNED
ncbi:MAG: hypothetical protein KIT33_00425 [Candidatus Kapabacteria bacterium]|nr:hypothetical protein [Ignavibacteriota bacterium]MCW5883413.1 hypothetical protein [Candidatus Kapabacteria bacterium]